MVTERDAIVADEPFRKSPTLVRLLRYLIERAVVDPSGRITQYDIAVEAMGKTNAFDFGNESYARVMVSRLRKALAQYYAAHPPKNGIYLHVPKGGYSIKLGSLKEAYPELASGETAELDADNLDAQPSPSLPDAPDSRKISLKGLMVAAALIIVIATAAALSIRGWRGDPGLAMSPVVQIVPESGNQDASEPAVQAVEELASSLATSSLVARISANDKADYVVGITADPAGGGIRLVEIALKDSAGNLISSAEYPLDPADPVTLDPIRSYLIDLFRPSGILTDIVLGRIDREQPRSAYECYIALDPNQAIVVDPDAVDNCVARFGEDRIYLPNVIARNAFSLYVQDLLAGGEVRSQGRAWQEAQRALRHGSTSLYTNVLLARIDFAEGRCERGLHRMERMNSRTEVFPSLRAMMLTDGMACMSEPAEREAARQEIRRLVSYNIDAAPILRAYLVLASLEAGDFQSARDILQGRRKGARLDQSLGELYAVMDEAVVAGAPVDPERLTAIVRVFVWNPEARASILRNLSAATQAGVS